MLWFDTEIAPPAPGMLTWLVAALLSLMIATLSLWSTQAEPGARLWIRENDACLYVPSEKALGKPPCQAG